MQRLVKGVSTILAVAFIAATIPALAADPRLATPPAPKQAGVMIAPISTAVASTEHYQAWMGLSCGDYYCIGDFPAPGRKHRLNISRLACDLHGTVGSAFDQGFGFLRDSAENVLFREDVPVDFSSSGGQHTINHEFDMQVGANQHFEIQLYLASGNAIGALCSVIGTLDTLQ